MLFPKILMHSIDWKNKMKNAISLCKTNITPLLSSKMVLIWQQEAILVQTESGLRIPEYSQIKSLFDNETNFFAIGTQMDEPFYILPLEGVKKPELNSDNLCYIQNHNFRTLPTLEALIFSTAHHAQTWYLSHIYCGKCATKFNKLEAEHGLRCPNCSQLSFPTISPAIIVAITDGDYLLVAQNVTSSIRFYSLIAGYVEMGETLEQAVYREALEEVGLELSDITYLNNQPWGISGSLMLAFCAKADRTKPLLLQKDEIKSAKWVHRNELTEHPYPTSIAAQLMERFRKREF